MIRFYKINIKHSQFNYIILFMECINWKKNVKPSHRTSYKYYVKKYINR